MKLRLTVVIVTYKRAAICLETIRLLIPLLTAEDELIVVEQESDEVRQQFIFPAKCRATFIRLPNPSTVGARNAGIQNAAAPVILFLDDDVVPSPSLLAAHVAAYIDSSIGGVAGRILGPLEELGSDVKEDPKPGWMDTNFAMSTRTFVETARGCNMSFRREILIAIGGFDTGFSRPFFFREDSDVCFRVRAAGYKMLFEPDAILRHLEAKSGGARSRASNRQSALVSELMMYNAHFHHYRDNLYFILKHFRSHVLARNLCRTYRTYVGISRWPWRLLAKNCCFLAALLNASWIKRKTHAPYFSPTPAAVTHFPALSASEGAA